MSEKVFHDAAAIWFYRIEIGLAGLVLLLALIEREWSARLILLIVILGFL